MRNFQKFNLVALGFFPKFLREFSLSEILRLDFEAQPNFPSIFLVPRAFFVSWFVFCFS